MHESAAFYSNDNLLFSNGLLNGFMFSYVQHSNEPNLVYFPKKCN